MERREQQYGAATARDLKLLVVLERCAQSVRSRLLPHVENAGLTLAQFSVLELLYHRGPMTVNGVIEKRLSSSGNIGVIIDNLIKEDWVEKRVDDSDGRVRYVSLTKTGEMKISNYFPNHAAEVTKSFAELTIDEKERLTFLLKKLGRSV